MNQSLLHLHYSYMLSHLDIQKSLIHHKHHQSQCHSNKHHRNRNTAEEKNSYHYQNQLQMNHNYKRLKLYNQQFHQRHILHHYQHRCQLQFLIRRSHLNMCRNQKVKHKGLKHHLHLHSHYNYML